VLRVQNINVGHVGMGKITPCLDVVFGGLWRIGLLSNWVAYVVLGSYAERG